MWHGSEAGVFGWAGARTGRLPDEWARCQTLRSVAGLPGSLLVRPPQFMKGRASRSRGHGKTARHLAGKEDRCLQQADQRESTREGHLQEAAFLGSFI